MARRTKQQWGRWMAKRLSHQMTMGGRGYINTWCHPFKKESRRHKRRFQRWHDCYSGWSFLTPAQRKRRRMKRFVVL